MNNEEKILQILGQLQEDMNRRFDMVDKDISDIRNRVVKLDTRATNIEISLGRVSMTQENTVVPEIKLLAEGHDVIQHQIKNISVIDRMQEDIDTLKAAVSYLSNKIQELEKAI